MDNESNNKRRLKGTYRGISSLLSNNRTIIAVVAFLYLLPLGTTAATSPTRALLSLMTQIMIFGLLAMSFDLQLGRSALLNFGQVALFGVGSYTIAFTLKSDILPPPFNLVAAIPFPLTIILAMMIGGFLGLIMGLTTSRLRGTAFAFIALAIAEFIYNFFNENPAISGGETGLNVPIPELIRTGPFYLFFVIISFTFLAAFVGMVVFYLKKRTEKIGLILIMPVMIAFTSVLFVFGTNILGPLVVIVSFLLLVLLYWFERSESISDPLQYPKTQAHASEEERPDILTAYMLPFAIVVLFLLGVGLAFGSNIVGLWALWVEGGSIFYLKIPVQYYLVLTCITIIYYFTRRLLASPFGRMITAVAQNEGRAEALGYNSYHAKIVVLFISGAIASLAGALYAQDFGTIDPNSVLGVNVTINAMLYTIIGGLGTLFGPILGAGVVEYSTLNLNIIFQSIGLNPALWLLGLGVVYVIIVLFMPHGIVGTIGKRSYSIKDKLRRFKLGELEFGLKDADYWILGLLGAMGLFLLLTEDAAFTFIITGIFGFLVAFVLFVAYYFILSAKDSRILLAVTGIFGVLIVFGMFQLHNSILLLESIWIPLIITVISEVLTAYNLVLMIRFRKEIRSYIVGGIRRIFRKGK
jgi:ABC-type branched-subunit amino acid transport system permease subunit